MHKLLEKVGLTPSESKVYLAVLKQPNATISELISTSKVSRSKIYEAIERLKTKGLLSITTKNNTKQIQALSPKRLLELVDSQEQELLTIKQELESCLPTLLAQQEEHKEEVVVYEGFKGMIAFFEDMKKELDADTEIKGVAFDRTGVNQSIKRMFHELQKERASQGAPTKILCNDPNQLPNKQNSYVYKEVYEFRVTQGPLPTGVQIYKDKVALFTWQQPKIILITSHENATYYKEFFDSLWEQAGK
jgi:sugar-specific transcriptional regulator TrmB